MEQAGSAIVEWLKLVLTSEFLLPALTFIAGGATAYAVFAAHRVLHRHRWRVEARALETMSIDISYDRLRAPPTVGRSAIDDPEYSDIPSFLRRVRDYSRDSDIGDEDLDDEDIGDDDVSVAPGVTPKARRRRLKVTPIFYGTDRARQDVEHVAYSGRRAKQLSLGVALVSTPKARKSGKVQRPMTVFSIQLEQEDENKHFVIQSVEQLSETAFLSRLNAEAMRGGDAPALLFIHGFNTSFEGGLHRAAQLAVDLNVSGPVLHYSWPSAGQVRSYRYDDGSVRQARAHFSAFLDVVGRSGVRKLNILAHSKGNDLLIEVLAARPKSKLSTCRQVVLASADVDADFSQQVIPAIGRKVKGLTLYACEEDMALKVSKLFVDGRPRLGHLMDDGRPLVVAGMDSIDASESKLHLSEFNHNSFVADTVLRMDLTELLASGRRPPHLRSASIVQRQGPQGAYWFLSAR